MHIFKILVLFENPKDIQFKYFPLKNDFNNLLFSKIVAK